MLAGLVAVLTADSHNGISWLVPSSSPRRAGYVGDGLSGGALARDAVTLTDSPFLGNMSRKLAYLQFLDPERLLRPFRLNYGQPSAAVPCGGWENPASQVRGHTTGHLMTALALTYAQTGSGWARSAGANVVSQLASLQARAVPAGFHPGYLSAFPESQFDRLEAGQTVWSPYYMIHKYLAGLIDQYTLAGSAQALEVAVWLGDWVCWRTGRLPYEQMQMVLETEFGGLPEALVNLYLLTGSVRYLDAAARFYHARVLDPLVRGDDQLAGVHANTTVPKIIWCARMGEVTGLPFYGDIARNFWDIVTGHHAYVIGGVSNHEHFQAPDAVASQLSDFTCENCVSYHMLRLTRLLFFEQQDRTDLLDYYERVLFNQMLGEQDPTSPHGFDCYYTGLSPGARKQQPLNYFPHGDPAIYATDYDTFTCDTATGLETPARFTEMIYSSLPDGLSVNLFIPSQVRYAGVVLSLSASLPDSPVVRL
ncbi:MAG TPA: beta-L-arabinofuranosidase domain-containing protein, partial [Streptosporangiaceae bacterium]|nr:beta-L-arabinofuranosidase domain-containing protein [Streptosporangiaceae bacterium]